MPERVAAEGETAEQHDVECEHESADADPEGSLAGRGVEEPKRLPDIDREKNDKEEREVEKIAVHVLHDQREGTLAEIRFSRFAHGAGRRIGPERLVIGAAIVITGEPQSARRPENE